MPSLLDHRVLRVLILPYLRPGPADLVANPASHLVAVRSDSGFLSSALMMSTVSCIYSHGRLQLFLPYPVPVCDCSLSPWLSRCHHLFLLVTLPSAPQSTPVGGAHVKACLA